jgi:glycine betaine catabolism B
MPTPTSASVLAFVTTLHVALTVLRKHRTYARGWPGLALLPSLLFCASPWFLTEPAWLAGAFAAHLAWFLACEKALSRREPGPGRSAAASSPPAAGPVVAGPAAAPRRSSARGFVAVPVLAVLEETEDIKTFRLARPEGFHFTPGQFLMVRVQVEGKHLVRCYSISSAPGVEGVLEISVKRQGLVSGTLHATLRPGSQLSIEGPRGGFVYPAGDDRPLVLLAAGVGITPLMGMLRHAVAAEPGRPVTLLFSVRSEKDIVYREELALLVRRHPQLRMAIALSRGTWTPDYYAGRIDARLIESFVPDPRGALHMICGPAAMIASMSELLASLGVPADQIRSEAFEPASAAAETTAAAMATARAAADAPGAVAHRVTFSRAGQTAAVAAGQSLLEAAEAAGVAIPSLCRTGACGTCRTRLVRGDVEADTSLLDAEDQEAGYILPCVAVAKGDCILDV